MADETDLKRSFPYDKFLWALALLYFINDPEDYKNPDELFEIVRDDLAVGVFKEKFSYTMSKSSWGADQIDITFTSEKIRDYFIGVNNLGFNRNVSGVVESLCELNLENK